MIEAHEVPLGPGSSAAYRVALDVAVDTAGTPEPDGSRRWELSASLPGDHVLLLETLAPEGSWYAPLFAGASYAVRLADEHEHLGVFEVAPAGLLLRGVVSPSDGPYRTELMHDPAVVSLSFPLEPGKSWQASATVSGLTSGVPSYFTESYAHTVDAHGVVVTPFGDFDVLRVHVELVRTVGVITTTVQTHVFVAECFGPVATLVSQDNEQATEFASAAEVRRLASP